MLEPEVVVQVAREMFLDAEESLAADWRADAPPAGSGVLLKSRLRLYSSSGHFRPQLISPIMRVIGG